MPCAKRTPLEYQSRQQGKDNPKRYAYTAILMNYEKDHPIGGVILHKPYFSPLVQREGTVGGSTGGSVGGFCLVLSGIVSFLHIFVNFRV